MRDNSWRSTAFRSKLELRRQGRKISELVRRIERPGCRFDLSQGQRLGKSQDSSGSCDQTQSVSSNIEAERKKAQDEEFSALTQSVGPPRLSLPPKLPHSLNPSPQRILVNPRRIERDEAPFRVGRTAAEEDAEFGRSLEGVLKGEG